MQAPFPSPLLHQNFICLSTFINSSPANSLLLILPYFRLPWELPPIRRHRPLTLNNSHRPLNSPQPNTTHSGRRTQIPTSQRRSSKRLRKSTKTRTRHSIDRKQRITSIDGRILCWRESCCSCSAAGSYSLGGCEGEEGEEGQEQGEGVGEGLHCGG